MVIQVQTKAGEVILREKGVELASLTPVQAESLADALKAAANSARSKVPAGY